MSIIKIGHLNLYSEKNQMIWIRTKYIAIFPSLSTILRLTKMSKKSIQFIKYCLIRLILKRFFLSNSNEMNEQTYPLLGLILWLESWRLMISKNVLMLSKRTSGLSRPSTRQAEITRYWKKKCEIKMRIRCPMWFDKFFFVISYLEPSW